jgi:hypothetical protein
MCVPSRKVIGQVSTGCWRRDLAAVKVGMLAALPVAFMTPARVPPRERSG